MTMDDCIKTLESSPTFHMSLGSKELFHSNFLHWLSVWDWDFFLNIMRKLSGKDIFWWESDYNLEVRRESNNFDLSIYISVGKNKWIPVLVLENKVKSIPYKKQLERYQEKALKEWGEKDKQEGRCISFILLSLWEGINGVLLEQKDKKSIVKWNSVSYDCLSKVLKEEIKNLKDDLNKSIINDYISFISSLSNLANVSWKLCESDVWSKVYPGKNNDDYIRYKKLRIHDLWEKIHYEQLLAMLIKQLKSTDNIKDDMITLDEDTYECGKVYCKAGYSHGIGAIEAHVKVGEIEYIIQVQGNQYRRAIVSNNFVDNESYYKRIFSCTTLQDKFAFYFQEDNKPYSFKGKNGKTFRYSKSTINGETPIKDIIKAMYDDIDYVVNEINIK